MTTSELEQHLIDTLREVQELSGAAPTAIDRRLCPIKDLEGFDSVRGEETTTLLGIKLNREFRGDQDDVNLFVSKDGRRALKVHEIVDRLSALIK